MKKNKITKGFSGIYKDLDLTISGNNVIDLRQKCEHNVRLSKTGVLERNTHMEDMRKLNLSDVNYKTLPDVVFKNGENAMQDYFFPNADYKPPAFSDKLFLCKEKPFEAKKKFPFSIFSGIFNFFKKEDREIAEEIIFPKKSKPIMSELIFFAAAVFFALFVWSLNLVEKSLGFERMISEEGISAFSDLALAADDISDGKLARGSANFKKASDKFSGIRQNLDKLGNLLQIAERIPLPKNIESKKALLDAGQHLSLAGTTMLGISSNLDYSSKPSLRETYGSVESTIVKGVEYLDEAISDLNKVDMVYVPEKNRGKFITAKEKLPALKGVLKNLVDNGSLAMKALGAEGSRKYLFLFENNHEIRAGGGFIGTYGVMEINNGKIVDFFIDDIYNPDGQLLEKIVPPKPVQRISDAWSMHDANWFADFPTTAKKVALFYEKTGGPTVDGVIAVTPELIKKLLEMTGPVEMAEYGKTVDSSNFMEIAQYEVEINYDKELNRPKKFISDLWDEMKDKVLDINKAKAISIFETLNELLKEKQILIYSRDNDIQEFIIKNGWGGQLTNVNGDFVSVVNSNLGGYKTDGVINEEIKHTAEVQEDGSVIDTVEITRYHLGGSTPYDWWNRVNVDYMRVYVPLGSQLLSAEGHTWEKPWREDHPFDYSRFKIDPDIEKIEGTMTQDKNTGTEIFEETGKTVFGNWVFVSPGESVTVTYKYKLPFNVVFDEVGFSNYSLYAQKQAGSKGSRFEGKLILPDNFKITWIYPDDFKILAGNIFRIDANLAQDKNYGLIIQNK